MQNNLKESTLLNEITKRMVSVGKPEKIILFGSRAHGSAHHESDYDLLVIEESAQPRYKRASKYRRVLKGLRFSKDIIVWTPVEVEKWKNVPNAFITTALKEGIVLYER
jgi:predicted nucleotidyltransferase